MNLANKKMRERIAMLLEQLISEDTTPQEMKEAAQEWLDSKDNADGF